MNINIGKSLIHVNINISNAKSVTFRFIMFYSKTENQEKYISNLTAKQNSRILTVVYKGDLTWEVQQLGGTLEVDYDVAKIVPFDYYHFPVPQKLCNVYVDDNGGAIYGNSFFIVPDSEWDSERYYVSSIKLKFIIPNEWTLITPYIDRGDYLEVPRITKNLCVDFAQRRGIYFGKMKFYEEEKVNNCIIKFGVLKSDENEYTRNMLPTQKEVQKAVHLNALAVAKLTEIFGENPCPVFPLGNTMTFGDWNFADGPGIIGGNQFWPYLRYDETVGHLFYLWVREPWNAPVGAHYLICKGIGECFIGNKLAYEITGDTHYLGKIYSFYLVYKGAQGTKFFEREEIKDAYYKGAVIGMYLDYIIQKDTAGEKSLEDVLNYLYNKYKNQRFNI
ncbi:MAG: hypothetical protein ACP5QM_07530 [Caldisericum sp.]|uniref:hypothetical protein n=1 Tax=Caldisericum sp. TaxID=2499687 RepID=UPI003D14E677